MSERKIKRVKLDTFLKNKKNSSQTAIAKMFGRTQPWLSQINKEHPGAKIVLVDGRIHQLEFQVDKVFTRVD